MKLVDHVSKLFDFGLRAFEGRMLRRLVLRRGRNALRNEGYRNLYYYGVDQETGRETRVEFRKE